MIGKCSVAINPCIDLSLIPREREKERERGSIPICLLRKRNAEAAILILRSESRFIKLLSNFLRKREREMEASGGMIAGSHKRNELVRIRHDSDSGVYMLFLSINVWISLLILRLSLNLFINLELNLVFFSLIFFKFMLCISS